MKVNAHEIPQGPRSTWGDLLRLSAGQPRLLALTIAATLIAQAGMVTSLALGAWLAGLALTGAPESLWQPVLWGMLVSAVAGAGGRWWQAHISHAFAFALIETLQVGIYDGLERAAPGGLSDTRSGEQANVALNDAQALEHFFAHTLADTIAAVVVPLLALLALAWIQPWLTLVLLPFLPTLTSVPFWLGERAFRQGREMNAALAGLNAEVIEGIEARREILLFNQEAAWRARLGQYLARLKSEQRRYALRTGAEQGGIELIQSLALITALVASAVLLEYQALELAQVPLSVVLVGAALLPLAEVARSASQLGAVRASAARVLALLHQRSPIQDNGQRLPKDASIEFNQVVFAHSERPVLQGVNFRVETGEMVALVGPSGAGKTTCANLLMRFYEVQSGTVKLGSEDLRDIPLSELRHWIAWVGQEAYLFDDSIEGNLRLGKPEATQQEIEIAAHQAQAHDFIQALPEGYQTRCGANGARLSGGQCQRIAIARALLSQAPVLVMDEASSSLDADSEHALQQALLALRGQYTLLVVAHRPSTIAQADRVVLLQDGSILDQGSHEQLLHRCEQYAQLLAQPVGA